jgi:Tol biopolymer transport system component/DNA-binding winged helix-turn-helix (wHTH) protein
MPGHPDRLFRFGRFTLDARNEVLQRDGQPVKLAPQPFKVLTALVQHAGDVVSRDQLRQEVWDGDTFVDFDQGLNFCIKQVRNALGDSADAPTFIETAPKRGYRFIAPVGAIRTGSVHAMSAESPESDAATVPTADESPLGHGRNPETLVGALPFGSAMAAGRDLLEDKRIFQGAPQLTAPASGSQVRAWRGAQRVVWTVTALSAAVATAVTIASFVRAPAVGTDVTRLDVVTPPTSDSFSFAISPDGRQLAFVANEKDVTQLWLRSFSSAAARSLPGTERAQFPFWAPDGRAIGFFADGKLKRIATSGSVPLVLADAPTARGGTWSPEGIIVIGQAVGGLARVSESGGALMEFTRVTAGQNNHRWPQFLPDGRILFFATGEPNARGVYVTVLGGGDPVRVTDAENAAAYAAPGYLLRVSQGTLTAQSVDLASTRLTGEPIPVAQGVGSDDGLYHAAMSTSHAGVLAHRAAAGGRRQLVWLDRAGKFLSAAAEPDTTGTASPDLAPDDGRIVVQRTVQGNNDVWVIDSVQALSSRLTFSAAIEAFPLWSPDGARVVFTSLRNGVADLFEKPANGSMEEKPFVVSHEPKIALDWSPDGSVVLYTTQSAATQSDLWVIPTAPGRRPFPVVQTRFDDVQGQFSPDGQWLAYTSNEAGGYEVYLRPFPEAGGRWQISNDGGTYPRWRRDGRELYYVAPGNRLMAVSIQPDAKGRTVSWSVAVPLFTVRFAAGVNIFAAGAQSRAQYAVSTDGRFLANVQVDDPVASPITVVLNWQAALQ